jgi:hypothetical protein
VRCGTILAEVLAHIPGFHQQRRGQSSATVGGPGDVVHDVIDTCCGCSAATADLLLLICCCCCY